MSSRILTCTRVCSRLQRQPQSQSTSQQQAVESVPASGHRNVGPRERPGRGECRMKPRLIRVAGFACLDKLCPAMRHVTALPSDRTPLPSDRIQDNSNSQRYRTSGAGGRRTEPVRPSSGPCAPVALLSDASAAIRNRGPPVQHAPVLAIQGPREPGRLCAWGLGRELAARWQ